MIETTTLRVVAKMSGEGGQEKISKVLRGTEKNTVLKNIKEYGSLHHFNKAGIKREIEYVIERNLVAIRTQGVCTYLDLTEEGWELILKKEDTIVSHGKKIAIYDALIQWRKEQSKKENCVAFKIITNNVIEAISLYPPLTLTDFIYIKGIGEKKAEKYGQNILEIIQQVD